MVAPNSISTTAQSGVLENGKLALFVSFGVMFSIAAVLSTVALMWGLGSVEDDLEKVLGEHREKMRLVVSMRNAARARTMRLSNMILFEDPFKKDDEYLLFNSHGAKFANSRMDLLKFNLNAEEQKILQEQASITGPTVSYQNDIVDLVFADEMDKALDLLTNKAIPLQDKVMVQLTRLHQYQEQSLDQAIKKTKENYKSIRMWILFVSSIAFIIGVLVALVIYNRNRRVSAERENYLQQIERSNQQLEIAGREAEKANVSKSTFLANMSHELRTPLNAIMGYSELLREELKDNNLSSAYLEDCEKIYKSGTHLLSLINEILDLSKIEAGKMTASCIEFPVRNIVESVRTIIEPLAEKNNNSLTVRYKLETGYMYSDDIKVKQILTNLLNNANKFTQGGEILLEVRSCFREGSPWVVFKVEDNGIGMEPEKVDQIFEPFKQIDDSSTRSYEGTGLGLAITKRFCELLQGSISIESSPGEGTRCIVSLPKFQEKSENNSPDQDEKSSMSA